MNGKPLAHLRPVENYVPVRKVVELSDQVDAREGSLALRMLDAERGARDGEQSPDWQILTRQHRRADRRLIVIACALGLIVCAAIALVWP